MRRSSTHSMKYLHGPGSKELRGLGGDGGPTGSSAQLDLCVSIPDFPGDLKPFATLECSPLSSTSDTSSEIGAEFYLSALTSPDQNQTAEEEPMAAENMSSDLLTGSMGSRLSEGDYNRGADDGDPNAFSSKKCIHFVLQNGLALTPPDIANGDLIGSGSYAKVYRIWSSPGQSTKPIAMKKLLHAIDTEHLHVGSPFRREIEILARSNHKHIVQYLGYSTQEVGLKYEVCIYMEYVSNGSLASWGKSSTVTIADAVDKTLQICRGLEYIHNLKIMHRDLKPGNILLTSDGICKLADFGLAKIVSHSTDVTQSGCKGTYPYMAPEVVMPGCRYSLPADIWSVGCIFCWLLAGLEPWNMITENYPLIFRLGNLSLNGSDAGPEPYSTMMDPPPFSVAIRDACFRIEPSHRFKVGQLIELLQSSEIGET
ncbi:kinase-like domain-containing protein [Mycena crocata]|nr:kinase-like domain-containing protein [Mycena crocata]